MLHGVVDPRPDFVCTSGAGMTSDGSGATGVTNHVGEVFVGSDTMETYPGLVVADAAVMPRALGVNPLATITALAERAVATYASRNELVIDRRSNGLLNLFEKPSVSHSQPQFWPDGTSGPHMTALCAVAEQGDPKVSFTELMTGFVHPGRVLIRDDKRTYELAYHLGKCRGETARLFVSITAPCVLPDSKGADNYGIMTGTFSCPGLAGSPFTILRSRFGTFEPNDDMTGTGKLVYEFDMNGVNGERLHFHGYKVTDPSIILRPSQVWQAMTTLYVSITDLGGADSGQVGGPHVWPCRTPVAMGIINIQLRDLLPAARTLTATGPSVMDRTAKATRYLAKLWQQPLQLFLTPLMPLQYPLSAHVDCINPTPPTQSFSVVASDGVVTKLHMWEPDASMVATDRRGDPVPIRDVFMIPGASVDHQIFALTTIPFNAVNYLTRAGYRVWVTVHRICRLETSHTVDAWTTHDSRLDIKACLETIRRLRGPQKIYSIAHCMGSVAFACGLLDGTIPAEWILGITCSQVFMNPIWSTVNNLKAKSPIPLDWLYAKLAGPYFDCSTSVDDKRVQQVVTQLLRVYPQERHEMCNNAVCLRTTFLFGRCWSHRNLNEATHSQIDRVFSGAHVNLMHLLMHMGSRGAVTGNAPEYELLVTPENIQRLRGIPFLLFNGADSSVLSPKAADETYNALLAAFGPSAGVDGAAGTQYRRRSVEGYGHLDCWMGMNAWRDVYPFVREEVDRVVRGEEYVFRQPNDKFAAMVEAVELLR
ncbi:hypothetical protein JDV02_004725 [Purpureocillium takamizusanense]|uniref:Glucose-methanol-choline oxidoreductase C-terminal domain-containing protein n=1 Tax=Purpureocillium takamizusanense TaxID=2060973 RepID=A0A9Q8QGY5_9HYPO|nr:uncharacterized protein JDV02_004725 [Purpureocillium takamizusanense]UNI18457.1 hypothetical protein JDV02_004725 [Purpureocillium takamizusanense]